jgi:hypothetical protein
MFSFMGSYLLGMPVVNLCFLLAAPLRPESEKSPQPLSPDVSGAQTA